MFLADNLPDGYPKCATGDGQGGSEHGQGGQYTFDECVTKVLEDYPDANGITMHINCQNQDPTAKCGCYAEKKMSYRNGLSNWFSCFLFPDAANYKGVQIRTLKGPIGNDSVSVHISLGLAQL